MAKAKSPFFSVPASGTGGTRVNLSCQVDPTLARRIQDICFEGRATGKYPWRTPGDVHRYLIVVGLEHFAKTIGQEPDTMQWHQIEGDIDHMAVDRQAAQALFDKASHEINELLSIDARDAAVAAIHLLVEDVLKVENQVWREWLVSEIGRAFPQYISADMPMAKFSGVKAGDVLGQRKKLRERRREVSDFAAAASKRRTERLVQRMKGRNRKKKKKPPR